VCIIQSDKAVEFKMLRKVMFSAATAGYQNVNFAVRPQGQGRRRRSGRGRVTFAFQRSITASPRCLWYGRLASP